MFKMIRNIGFLIIAMLIMYFAFYTVFHIDYILEKHYEALTDPTFSDVSERVLSLYQNNSKKFVLLFLSFLQLVSSAWIFAMVLSDTIFKKKSTVLAISLFWFFSSESFFVFLLSVIQIIILLTAPKESMEKSHEKLSLPINEKTPLKRHHVIFLIILLIVYLSQILLDYVIPRTISYQALQIIGISYYVVLFVLALLCLITIYRKDILLFFHHFKAYWQQILPFIGWMYLCYFSISFLIALFCKDMTSVNQSLIEEMPLYITAPLAIIWAPIVEEVVFRGALRHFIKHDLWFIALSGIIFGLLHTISEESLSAILIHAIPYSTLGIFFAYLDVKNDNLSGSILVHALHNTLGVLILALMA